MTPEQIRALIGGAYLYPRSVQYHAHETYCYVRDGHQHYMLIIYDPQLPGLMRDTFGGETQDIDADTAIKWCLPSHSNARKLRRMFPWTAPQPLGLKTTFGAGDRLGLAAPAHIHAARECGVALVLAQQSIREMTRTQRTPEQVLDAATWGVFQENYQEPWGADADHLKTEEDVRKLAAAGFTFFTIDPSAYVDDAVASYDAGTLATHFDQLDGHEGFAARYENQDFDVPGEPAEQPLRISVSADKLRRAAVKYALAIAHTQQLYTVLTQLTGEADVDFEMSVDETESPTTVEEHFFIASELKQRGVKLQSLAIRFVGEFQKGIDYKGDLVEFQARFREHVLIARHLGPYKISIHSGSDKFSIFPIAGRLCGGLLHEKTAGTWYLEALRVIARIDPALFREICDFARARFPTDRATYHVVPDLRGLPDYAALPDADLERVLDSETGRQMLHVTFGSVLTDKKPDGTWRFRDRLYWILMNHEDLHHAIVREHSLRHMRALGMCEDATQ